MISKRKRLAVAELIDEGLSDRQISGLKKLSRDSVAYIRKRKKVQAAMRVAPLLTIPSGKRRCQDCGGIVEMPCKLCRTRRITSEALTPELNFRQLARNTLLAALIQPPLRRRVKGERRRAS